MREADIENFIKTYSSEDESIRRGPFTYALGYDPKFIITLHELIYSDFDPLNYGIGWWKSYEPQLTWKQRVLISDQLFKCLSTVEGNLLDLHLHFLEVSDYWERYNNRVEHSASFDLSKGLVQELPAADALTDISLNMTSIHTSGFFRAVGSIADCLAGTIIGVVGVPLDLKRADLDRTRKYLRNGKNLTEIQRKFGEKLESQIMEAGPEGWLSWAMQYRNMLVHRAKRMPVELHKAYSFPRPSSLPRVKIEAAQHLVLNPELSDIEAYIQNDLEFLLPEPAEDTMRGIMGSLHKFLDSCLNELTEVWRMRKADPTLIIQPSIQWRDAPNKATEKFVGYGSDPMFPKFKEINSSRQMMTRIKSASLDGNDIKRWKS